MLTYPFGNGKKFVIIAHRVVTRGGAYGDTVLFGGLQFFLMEFGLPDAAPVVVLVKGVEARRERAVGSDKGTILTGAAVPGLHMSPHSVLEGLEMVDRIDHGPTLPLFVDEPVQDFVHLIVSIRRDV